MKKIIKKFKDRQILVIGDVMLDKYIWGEVERISPEAPVQIVEVTSENYVPGGAANVANNLSSLGATPLLIGIVGRDSAKKRLEAELKDRKIKAYLIEDERPTIQKVRVLAQNQQLVRIDYEDKKYIEKHIEDKIIRYLEKNPKIEGIIISDYAKGIITRALVSLLVGVAKKRKIPLVVDPKPKHIEYYHGVTLITPNNKEASEMARIPGDTEKDIEVLGDYLTKQIDSDILITRGSQGMSIITRDGKKEHIKTRAREIYDVSGAGDTVVASVTLAIVCGASIAQGARIANHAAGVVVGKVGTSTVTMNELFNTMDEE